MKNSWKCMLLCVAMVLAFAACSNNGEGAEALPDDGAQEPKEYVVSLGMAGEILEIEESPLSKAEGSNDLYGVQVYSKTATTEYTPYAYGLFDNTADMTIRLLAGYEYKFVATMVVDGKEKVQEKYTDDDEAYLSPFSVSDLNDWTPLKNTFIYGLVKFDRLDQGYTLYRGYEEGEYYNHPLMERFYGEIEGYIPETEVGVSIFMKRVCFGVKFIAEGLTDGRLVIDMEETPEMSMTMDDVNGIQEMVCFENPYPSGLQWTGDDYSETIPVSVTWERADGAIVPLITNKDITFKRNVLTTITIKVDEAYIEGGVELDKEEGEMEKGEDIVLEGTVNQ